MKFNKSILALAAVAATFAAGSAMASDGTINFTGSITAASCSITGNTGANVSGEKGKQNIAVNLGKVSADAIGSTENGGVSAGTNISLALDCGASATDVTTVAMKFDAVNGSGLDGKNNKLLKVAGDAEGVGIGLFDADNKQLNLAANDTITGKLVKGGTDEAPVYTATLNLRAGYMANGAAIKPGVANGTLPFTLTYQ
ncbi:MAG: type 1 fimbrial protein [Burkholderia sp.]|uniref:fimbrial protein n=1 Tax=Burkholderia sp. TaxID=36773 RepID=UPI002828121C|nr:fimbrial protein [Burkholderia sp.]MDR0240947.1 type 1 fimbrial protein [Burkholderia sp.]